MGLPTQTRFLAIEIFDRQVFVKIVRRHEFIISLQSVKLLNHLTKSV